MLRLAPPTIGVLIVQTLVGLAETFYASFLGTDALVGVSLVFPIWMLMTMSSSGGIGIRYLTRHRCRAPGGCRCLTLRVHVPRGVHQRTYIGLGQPQVMRGFRGRVEPLHDAARCATPTQAALRCSIVSKRATAILPFGTSQSQCHSLRQTRL